MKRQEQLSILKQIVATSWPNAQLRDDADGNAWQKICQSSAYVTMGYLNNTIDYHLSYLSSVCDAVIDLSIIIYQDNQAVALWPLNLNYQNGQWQLLSNSAAIVPPLTIDTLTNKQVKRLYLQCVNFLQACGQQLSILPITSSFNPINNALWVKSLTPFICNASYQQLLFIDLTKPLSEIKNSFRKSYKPLVNKGLKLWHSELKTELSDSDLEEIRLFHQVVAGKETRNKMTWNLQKKMVDEQEAFVVILRDKCGKLVGIGLFNLTKGQGVYSMGIYDRNLFELPLGHVVQMLAIEYMQKLKLADYFIGYRHHNFETPTPSKKESSIGFFKEGFSNLVEMQCTVTLAFN